MSQLLESDLPADLEVRDDGKFFAPIQDVEIREGRSANGDDEVVKLLGHAAVFDRLSEDLGGFRERIQRGAFRKVLDASPDVRFLINHDGLPLARTTSRTLELREDPTGLRTYAEFDPANPRVQELASAVKRGDANQMSFGFTLRGDGKAVWEEDPDGGLIRTIINFGGLFDVSLVTFPAYTQTDAGLRSICGTKIFDESGSVDLDALRALAWDIHKGEVKASSEERSRIDAAYASTDSVSPWTAQRAHRAISLEPELQGVVQSGAGDNSREKPEGGRDPIAARRLELELKSRT